MIKLDSLTEPLKDGQHLFLQHKYLRRKKIFEATVFIYNNRLFLVSDDITCQCYDNYGVMLASGKSYSWFLRNGLVTLNEDFYVYAADNLGSL